MTAGVEYQNMTKKIVWRLANRPTPMEIISLKAAGLLKNEEAREMLFTLETEEERDKKSLESEIKFLRELVEKLSNGNRTTIVEAIRYEQTPYQSQTWYHPYKVWCGVQTGVQAVNIPSNSAQNLANLQTAQSGYMNVSSTLQTSAFSKIKTF